MAPRVLSRQPTPRPERPSDSIRDSGSAPGLRTHFIVCAYGRGGRAVARELERAGAPFVVVDPLEELEERMVAHGVTYLIGDPSLELVLRAAGVERARALICAVDSDATNIYIALMARSLNPRLFIVARASDPGSDDRLRRAGADRVVSPFVESGRHMAAMALRPGLVDVFGMHTTGPTSLARARGDRRRGGRSPGRRDSGGGGPPGAGPRRPPPGRPGPPQPAARPPPVGR